MKKHGAYVVALALSFGVVACDDDSSVDGASGTDGASSASDGDGGDSNGSGGSPGQCEQQSPEGDACGDGDDCSVACLCGDGVVNSGRCVNGSCADPQETCADACDEFDAGDFPGAYCALDNSGGSSDDDPPDPTGSDDSGDGGQCVPTGETCEINGDCCGFDAGTTLCTSFSGGLVACADVCFFDSDCVSDCCVSVDSGGGVCGPSTECV